MPALRRAARFGDGWLPMGLKPAELAPQRAQYDALAGEFGRPRGSVSVLTGLPLQDPARLRDALQEYAHVGVDRVICAVRYTTFSEYSVAMGQLAAAGTSLQ